MNESCQDLTQSALGHTDPSEGLRAALAAVIDADRQLENATAAVDVLLHTRQAAVRRVVEEALPRYVAANAAPERLVFVVDGWVVVFDEDWVDCPAGQPFIFYPPSQVSVLLSK